jgi:regulator of cell morphogenesis and NO signaling
MEITKKSTVGQVVARDYHAASVFKKHHIDFCCKGGVSIEEACENKGMSADALVEELKAATAESGGVSHDFQTWDLDLLCDYIEKKHHRYVLRKTPELRAYLAKLSKVHGERHPELLQIERLFDASATELASHMHKEEMILFPYIKSVAQAAAFQRPSFGTVKNPINMMQHEHDTEGERFRRIAELSSNYLPPADACTTYRVAFALLAEFEEDLHLHIHLENNILFPRAIAHENRLADATTN